jgi:hypothetical protein
MQLQSAPLLAMLYYFPRAAPLNTSPKTLPLMTLIQLITLIKIRHGEKAHPFATFRAGSEVARKEQRMQGKPNHTVRLQKPNLTADDG